MQKIELSLYKEYYLYVELLHDITLENIGIASAVAIRKNAHCRSKEFFTRTYPYFHGYQFAGFITFVNVRSTNVGLKHCF